MAKHTPGPWRYADGFVPRVMAGNASVAGVHKTGRFSGNVNNDQVRANGLLIAAAPELYEALTELVQEIETDGGIDTSDWPLLDAARAALAKVNGP